MLTIKFLVLLFQEFVQSCNSGTDVVGLVLDKTPLYAEQGGQTFDKASSIEMFSAPSAKSEVMHAFIYEHLSFIIVYLRHCGIEDVVSSLPQIKDLLLSSVLLLSQRRPPLRVEVWSSPLTMPRNMLLWLPCVASGCLETSTKTCSSSFFLIFVGGDGNNAFLEIKVDRSR